MIRIMANRTLRIVACLAATANVALAGYVAQLEVPVAAAQALPSAPNSTLYSDALPPERFRGSFTVLTTTDTPEGVDARCRAAGSEPPPGWRIRACVIRTRAGPTAIMPNPCLSPTERYAALYCHEGAHVSGWPSTHGD